MGLFDEVLENVGKEYKGGGKGFTFGTHEVVIGTVQAKNKDTKKAKDCASVEVVVFDETDNEKSATCTLWFHTTGAAKMSVTKVLGLLVHKAGEEKKDAVRELGKKLFASIEDPIESRDVAAKLMSDKLIGAKAYLVAQPQGNYSTTSYGDLWHYPAEVDWVDPEDKAKAAAATVGGSVVEDAENLPDFDQSKGDDL